MTAKIVAEAAADGNQIAREVLEHACRVLGWGIAQAITLISPGVVVVGGGVSLMDESLFLAPLRREVERYVFPPQIGYYHIQPAALGELVVVHGALAAARQRRRAEFAGRPVCVCLPRPKTVRGPRGRPPAGEFLCSASAAGYDGPSAPVPSAGTVPPVRTCIPDPDLLPTPA